MGSVEEGEESKGRVAVRRRNWRVSSGVMSADGGGAGEEGEWSRPGCDIDGLRVVAECAGFVPTVQN